MPQRTPGSPPAMATPGPQPLATTPNASSTPYGQAAGTMAGLRPRAAASAAQPGPPPRPPPGPADLPVGLDAHRHPRQPSLTEPARSPRANRSPTTPQDPGPSPALSPGTHHGSFGPWKLVLVTAVSSYRWWRRSGTGGRGGARSRGPRWTGTCPRPG